MIDFVKAKAPVLAVGALGWCIYSALAGKAPPKDDGQRKIPEVTAADMRQRGEAEVLTLPSDPCRQGSGKVQGAMQSSDAADRKAPPGASAGAKPGDAASVTLTLDAVLFAGAHSVAVLNRQSLSSGQRILGVDDASPPVLEEIGPTWVRVQYGGRQQRLDLDGTREAKIERAGARKGRE